MPADVESHTGASSASDLLVHGWSSAEADRTSSLAWGDVDSDGDLDLAVGNYYGPNRLYRSENGNLSESAVWSSAETDNTTSVAWGDIDGDGDLDLAVGNEGASNRLYRNDGGSLTRSAVWSSTEAGGTSVAWGDIDSDGDLDLAVGGFPKLYRNDGGSLTQNSVWSSTSGYSNSVAWGDVDSDGDLDLTSGSKLYRNEGGSLTQNPIWSSTDYDYTTSVAWGDVDGDGDLDLAVGYYQAPNRLYRNDGGSLTQNPIWSSTDYDYTTSVAWGDVDGDGDLDLAVGNRSAPNRLYRNDGGSLTTMAAWSPVETNDTSSVAWGDIDGDGDLELAVGNYGAPNRLYRNESDNLSQSAVWSAAETYWTSSVAWGDVDGDGDLDLAGDGPKLYRNESSNLTESAVWSAAEVGYTSSMSWGDVDGDGDLDLALGKSDASNQLYRNDSGSLTQNPIWLAAETNNTTSLEWGDVDSDGDLDLAVGNYGAPNRLYRNDGGSLTESAVWSSSETDSTWSVAWGDVDDDGDLDLAVGNGSAPNRLYRNDGGSLTQNAVWSSVETDPTSSVAWGDVDGDGDLDLAVGNGSAPNRLYRNDGGSLTQSAVWSSSGTDWTSSVAWGDVDGDGDLDLAVGNYQAPTRLYRNEGGSLTQSAVWSSSEPIDTSSVAWGDVDGDGDLDLAAGGAWNRLYRNENGNLTASVVWSTFQTNDTQSVAWGDVDGDGDFDLAVGNWDAPNQLYRNDGGSLTASPVWSSIKTNGTTTIAWGDADGDGDLDLVVGNGNGAPNRLYRNEGSSLTRSAIWSSSETNITYSVAWGDVDGDGDLDLAVGNWDAPNQLYRNDGGSLTASPIWSSSETNITNSVAWGDVDGDGDLDLAVGNVDAPNQLYRNDGGSLTASPVWSSSEAKTASTMSVAWGDVDGDGDLDLAVGNRYAPNQLYRNDSGSLTAWAAWSSAETSETYSVAWGDVDGDGDLDLAAGNVDAPNKLYRNDDGSLTASPIWSSSETASTMSVAWGDVDGDGDLDLATGNSPAQLYRNMRFGHHPLTSNPRVHLVQPDTTRAPFYSTATIWPRPTMPITYTLSDPSSRPVGEVIGQYSIDGGGQWYPAMAAPGNRTANLPTTPTGAVYTYTWDIFASGLLGQSDNVVFRLLAFPSLSALPNQIPGPYLYGATASSTLPFRVRVSQVRVLRSGQPQAGALVYRLPHDQAADAQPYRNRTGQPWQTTARGELPGLNQLQAGDQLVALLPITATTIYSLYLTSAAPTDAGLDLHRVTEAGIQTLNISNDHMLMLFNLRVSLEWDARRDTTFLEQLQANLRRASDHLYDWSNGQIALGRISIYHDKEQWNDADIRIYATNYLRPNAVQGGWGTTVISDPDIPALDYRPGQVRMGVVWNRSGTPGLNLGEDWARTLAHELGHYLLYLDDNYLGLDAQGTIVPLDGCPGAMSDPYIPDESEFHPQENWLPECEQTLSNHGTGRSDWTTIQTFYPWLHAPSESITAVNPGPNHLPLAVTQIQFVEPSTSLTTLVDPLFYPIVAGRPVQLSASARAVLFRDRQPPPGDPGIRTPNATKNPDRLIDLGRPTQDVVKAHGARLGDRLCIYDQPASLLGCTTIQDNSRQIVLARPEAWQPQLTLTPVTSDTITLRVDNVPTGLTLHARLFPSDLPDPLLQPVAADPPTIDLSTQDSGYRGTFADLAEPVFEGHIQIWVDEPETAEHPRRETITDFALGGDPGRIKTGSGRIKRNGGGRIKTGSVPLLSADGQAALFADELDLSASTLFTLQPLTAAPALPPWASPIGPAYQLTATGEITALLQSVLSLTYAPSQVPQGAEDQLQMYYWDTGRAAPGWQVLPPRRDPAHRMVSAPTQGPGIYALVVGTTTPQIATLTPQTATTDVTTTLRIEGSAFLAPAQLVLLGATSAYTLPASVLRTDTITTTIPAGLPAGEYQIGVVNGDERRAEAPQSLALYDPAEACFADRFSSGSSQWSRTSQWDITALPGGEQAMTDSPQGSYAQASTATQRLVTSIASQPFGLEGCATPVLTFRHDYVLARSGASVDVGRVEFSADGGNTWTTLATYSGAHSTTPEQGLMAAGESTEWIDPHWESVRLPLPVMTGTAQLRFSLEVDDRGADKGWLIDEVLVTNGHAQSPTLNRMYLPIIVGGATDLPSPRGRVRMNNAR